MAGGQAPQIVESDLRCGIRVEWHRGGAGKINSPPQLRRGGALGAGVVSHRGAVFLLACAVRIEVAQQAVAQALGRNSAQLLLDAFEGAACGVSSCEGVIEVEGARIQMHWIETGEPADRAREV